MEMQTWKHDELKAAFPEAQTLGDLVKGIETHCLKNGKLVCRVAVNGMNLDEGQESKFQFSDLAEIQSVSVELNDLTNLLMETKESSVAYAKNLERVSPEVAEMFRSERLYEAHQNFRILMEGLDSLITAIQLMMEGIKKLGGEPGAEWIALDRSFVVMLGAILEAYEKRDFILVADQLEYELTKGLADYSRILEGVQISDKDGEPRYIEETQDPLG